MTSYQDIIAKAREATRRISSRPAVFTSDEGMSIIGWSVCTVKDYPTDEKHYTTAIGDWEQYGGRECILLSIAGNLYTHLDSTHEFGSGRDSKGARTERSVSIYTVTEHRLPTLALDGMNTDRLVQLIEQMR